MFPFARLFALLLLPAALTAAEWDQWRGPGRDARVESLPASLDGLIKQWSAELGPSYSGPVADESRVYTTMTEDKAREVVIALDRRTGDEVWRTTWDGAMSVPFFAASNGSWIRATPALAGGRLYVAGMTDLLVCLHAATGDEVSRRDFAADSGEGLPQFGNVASPLVREGLVYVQSGDAVQALDAATGETKWTALPEPGGRNEGAFSSPAVAEDAPGGPQVLVQTRKTLAGLDPSSGEVLWQTPVEAFRGMNILTPLHRVVNGDLQVFTSTYGGGSTLFGVSGGRGEVATLWTAKPQGYMSSPVLVGERLVLHLRNQRATALDWSTGEVAWTSRPFGKYWSMLTDGTGVVALDSGGRLLRVDPAGEEMTVLEERPAGETETWAHLAWDGRQLFVRRLDGLDAYAAE